MNKFKIAIVILSVFLISIILIITFIIFHLNNDLKDFYDTQPYISCDLNDDKLKNYEKRDTAIIYNYYFNSEEFNKISDPRRRNLLRNFNNIAIYFVSESNKNKYFKTLSCDHREDIINAS